MPYIDRVARQRLNAWSKGDPLAGGPQNPGELAYVLTKTVNSYLEDKAPLDYDVLAGVTGALESTTDEFKRQVVQPYEDHKKLENGPVLTVLQMLVRAERRPEAPPSIISSRGRPRQGLPGDGGELE